MSETPSETTKTTSRRKSDTSSANELVVYEQAVEQGYIGGPVDETDYSLQGDLTSTPIDEKSITHEHAPAKAAELQAAYEERTGANETTGSGG